ncbi:MAG: phage tail tube protein [Roseovarius sp.]|nr:phage tail tube protein [Roseovarius sp.]
MARGQGARSQMALAFETTYGTAPVSGYTRMPFAPPVSLSSEQPLLASELLGFGRDPVAPIKDAVTADGNVTVPIDLDAFGFWLKGTFGSPVTTGTTTFTHVFTSGAFVLPSMSIEIGMPEIPSFSMYSGARVDTLSWTMQRSGPLTASVGLIAQGETRATSTQAGTPAAITLQRFGHFNGSVKRGGTLLGNVVSASVNYSNTLDRIETIRADGKIDGVDPGIAALTGDIVVRFADTALLDQATNGSPAAFEFSWSLGASKTLTVAVPVVYLPVPRREISGPGAIEATFAWQAAQQANGDPMVTVTLVNSVSAY